MPKSSIAMRTPIMRRRCITSMAAAVSFNSHPFRCTIGTAAVKVRFAIVSDHHFLQRCQIGHACRRGGGLELALKQPLRRGGHSASVSMALTMVWFFRGAARQPSLGAISPCEQKPTGIVFAPRDAATACSSSLARHQPPTKLTSSARVASDEH